MLYILKKASFVMVTTSILLLGAVNSSAHSGPDNEGSVLSCEKKKRSDSCQYTGNHNDLYIGYCRYRYMTGEDLICVRTEPIQKADPTEGGMDNGHTHSEAQKPKA